MLLIVIPARYGSTRFPGKPLAMLGGKTIIQRVYERAGQVRPERLSPNFGADAGAGGIEKEQGDEVPSRPASLKVVVATDDERIYDHVTSFGGTAEMTRSDHPSGTDRVAEVAARYPTAEIVVNVQGDEPFIDPRQIEQVVSLFSSAAVDIATLAHPITEERSLLSPNVVKVVRDARGRALYFSRHAIPFLRDLPVGQWILQGKHLQHLGLYAYRNRVLPELTELSESGLEANERLEQLRWLEAGYHLQVGLTNLAAFGIDTPEDLRTAELYLRKEEG